MPTPLGIHYNAQNDFLEYLEDPRIFAYEDGYAEVPEGPGLGIEVSEDRVREAASVGHDWRNPVWRNQERTVAEW